MKKLLTYPTLLVLLLSACTSDEPTPTVPAEFSRRTTEFSFDFFRRICAASPDENLIVSPLSLHVALGMLLNGADASTRTEIEKVLRLKGYSPDEANAVYQTLLTSLPKADPKVQLGLANSVWYRKDLSVEESYIQTLQRYFGAEVKPLTTVEPVNQWASEKTNGKIKKILDRIDPNLFMLLMNAVYFKGDWQYAFTESATRDQDFTLASGERKSVKMMNQEVTVRGYQGTDYQAVELPYGNGTYRMTLLLPPPGTPLDAFVDGFGADDWEVLQSRWQSQKYGVLLPRFEFETEKNLNELLSDMGMPASFLPSSANFSKIRRENDLFVSFVKQKAYIKTDEKGSEAAAVTAIGLVKTSLPSVPTFLFDRPFALLITDASSGTVLFTGKVVNP